MTTTNNDWAIYRTVIRNLLAAHRRENPLSRAVSIYAYRVNTGRRARRDCVLCGHQGISWCNDYPRTVQSYGDEIDHEYEHVQETVLSWGGLGLYGQE